MHAGIFPRFVWWTLIGLSYCLWLCWLLRLMSSFWLKKTECCWEILHFGSLMKLLIPRLKHGPPNKQHLLMSRKEKNSNLFLRGNGNMSDKWLTFIGTLICFHFIVTFLQKPIQHLSTIICNFWKSFETLAYTYSTIKHKCLLQSLATKRKSWNFTGRSSLCNNFTSLLALSPPFLFLWR